MRIPVSIVLKLDQYKREYGVCQHQQVCWAIIERPMMKNIFSRIFIVPAIVLVMTSMAGAVVIPPQEQAGAIEARRQSQENDLKLKNQVKKKAPPQGEETAVTAAPGAAEGAKVLITRIDVEGAVDVPMADIARVTAAYEGKELSMGQMQEVVNKITELYRQRGLITSRAILPPQKVEGGVLKITIMEGRTGKVSVQGNRFYSSALILRKMSIKEEIGRAHV